MTERKLRLTRNDPSRDPMLKGVWISAGGSLPQIPTPPTEPFVIAPDPPPPDPLEEKWKAAVDVAGIVVETMRQEFPDLDSELLLNIIRDIVQNSLDTSDIAAIYRHRKGNNSHA